MSLFDVYITEIAKVKDEPEHSGRTFLQNLLAEFTNQHKINIIHESKRDKQGRGSPDFKFELNGTVIGYLENKKIGENLDEVLKSKQIEKYKTLADNIIITDYLRWIWIYKDQIVADETLCNQDNLGNKNIKLNKANCQKITELINNFLTQKPQQIDRVDTLAVTLARPAVYIKEGIEEELKVQLEEKQGQLYSIYQTFKGNLISDLSIEEFSDAFTQTLVYSLFIAKLESLNGQTLTIYNIGQYFPSSFSLIGELIIFVEQIRQPRYEKIAPFIERLLHIVNTIDVATITENLTFKYSSEKDPYIYFYEDFLHEYDKQIKADRGVYYTPPSVVTFIVRTLDDLLKTEFNLEDGLGTIGIEVLDFACGTGTFLLELYKQVLTKIPDNRIGDNGKEGIVYNHLLKKVYGFELMIAPYAIAHLKLSQFLKQEGFNLGKSRESTNSSVSRTGPNTTRDQEYHRIPVYLTNTLENLDWEFKQKQGNQVTLPFFSFIEQVAKEGEKAQKIKDSSNVFVIMGNPPYNYKSKNNGKYINHLVSNYYFIDGKPLNEKNPKGLQDDYVKFIRFAEEKIAKHPHGGVIGIITPHSFLDNPTFRGMRRHLMNTFDKMYFIDLHGNTRKKEKDSEGGKDENVFDIMQGVAISILVKNPEATEEEKGIYRLDIYGKRKQKGEQLLESNIEHCNNTQMGWKKLNPVAPFYLFTKQDEALRTEYDKGWSLKDIFAEMSVGIVTGKDEKVIAFDEQELKEKVTQHFGNFDTKYIQNISYRPFDTRKIYYDLETKGLIERGRKEAMQQFLGRDNVGLCFIRNNQGVKIDHFFVSETLTDGHLLGGLAYITPLCVYTDHLGEEVKTANLKPEFLKFTNTSFNSTTPEQILGYIYAVLHSTNYRTKYLEFLKIDFPKIPFDISAEQFNQLSLLGQELIEAHLMKKIPSLNIGEYLVDKTLGDINYICDKPRYDDQNQRLYFNQSCYFDKVSREVYEFKIGGYQVLDKYLKSRKNMSIECNLKHLQDVVRVLQFTVDVIKKIAKVIDLKETYENCDTPKMIL